MKTAYYLTSLFKQDTSRAEGVRPIQLFLLRLVFVLTFLFVGMSAWTAILTHEGEWKPLEAVAFSVWAAYSALSFLGILKPLKMLPIIAFQIFYKIVWLIIVAYPAWAKGTLEGSAMEEMTHSFLWVILPIIAMPWTHFFMLFFRRKHSGTTVHV